MDLPDTWNNYKSLLAIIANNDQNAIKDFLAQLCSPPEDFANSGRLTRLFAIAVALKNCEIVSVLLKHEVRPKPCYELFEYTPIQAAAMSGNATVVQEMVQRGVGYDDVDNDGNTLLHLAVRGKNELWKNVGISDTRQSMKSETDRDVASTMKILLDLGLDVDAKNKSGYTPLSFAVQYRMKMVTELLVERNASLTVHGKSVAHYLIMDELNESCRAESSRSREDGLWSKHEKSDFMDWWFSKKIDLNYPCNGETPLQLCARYSAKSALIVLLKYTDAIHEVDALGRSLLHIILQSVENSPRTTSKTDDIEVAKDIVKMLLDRGISVDETDKCGNTPFHLAAKLKRPEIMQMILERFNNVNVFNNMRETALHMVTKYYNEEYGKEYFDVICDLIYKGADCNFRNISGKIPLHFLCLKPKKMTNEIVHFLISRDCDLNIRDCYGFTPLHLAIKARNVEIVKILMGHVVEVNSLETCYNSTPLHEATRKNLIDVVERLLEAGAKPDIRNKHGQTPLHVVASNRLLAPQSMSLLLMFGADAEVEDNENRTPLYRAFHAGNYKRIGILLNFGARASGVERWQLMATRVDCEKNLLIKHLVARAVAGLYVSNCYAAVVLQAQREYAHFHEQCARELNLMKATTIDDLAVYDLLRMNLIRRFRYMMREPFMEFATDYKYLKDKFPIYRHIISASYWTAVKRKPLVESAKDAWLRLTRISLPEYCLEHILHYLENFELKLMIEAGA